MNFYNSKVEASYSAGAESVSVTLTGCGFDLYSRKWNIYFNLYFQNFEVNRAWFLSDILLQCLCNNLLSSVTERTLTNYQTRQIKRLSWFEFELTIIVSTSQAETKNKSKLPAKYGNQRYFILLFICKVRMYNNNTTTRDTL